MLSFSNRMLRRHLRIARAAIVLALFAASAGSFRTALIRQIGDDKLGFRSVALPKPVRRPVQDAALLLAPASVGLMTVTIR